MSNGHQSAVRVRSLQQTACILCSLNCGLEVDVEDGHFVRIKGDKAPSHFAGIHLPEGAAARPLPERQEPRDAAAAAA